MVLYKVCRVFDKDSIFSPLVHNSKYNINYSKYDEYIYPINNTLGIFCYTDIDMCRKLIIDRLSMQNKLDFIYDIKFLHQSFFNYYQYIYNLPNKKIIKHDYVIFTITTEVCKLCPNTIPSFKDIDNFYNHKKLSFNNIDIDINRRKKIILCDNIIIPYHDNHNLINYINNKNYS